MTWNIRMSWFTAWPALNVSLASDLWDNLQSFPSGIHYFWLLSSVKVVVVELKWLFNPSLQLNLATVCISLSVGCVHLNHEQQKWSWQKKKVDLPYVLFYFPTVFTKLSFTVTKHCEKTNTTTIHQHLQIKLSGSVTFFIFAEKKIVIYWKISFWMNPDRNVD